MSHAHREWRPVFVGSDTQQIGCVRRVLTSAGEPSGVASCEFGGVAVVSVAGGGGPFGSGADVQAKQLADYGRGQFAGEVHQGAIATDASGDAQPVEPGPELFGAEVAAGRSAGEEPGVILGSAEDGVAVQIGRPWSSRAAASQSLPQPEQGWARDLATQVRQSL
ncbi:MAG: hypothetical protein JWN52_6639 [Actinomycetia bacterium]|nr:hypothetical protein [Actinomycetes bacterium]